MKCGTVLVLYHADNLIPNATGWTLDPWEHYLAQERSVYDFGRGIMQRNKESKNDKNLHLCEVFWCQGEAANFFFAR